jgi:Membrane protein involved in the export of O-antigen and teichoic acid
LSTNQRKSGIILAYLNILVSALVNIVNVPLFLHFIGINEYGIYETIGSLVAYFSILDFGLPATIIVFYSRYKTGGDQKNAENILAICSRIYIAITAVILTAGIFLYFFLDSLYANSLTATQLVSAKQVYIVFLVNVACTLPFQIFVAILTVYEKFIFLKGTLVLLTIFQALTIVPVVFKFPCALSIVIVQTIFNAAMAAARCIYCFKVLKVKIKLHFFDIKLFKSILNYSLFVFLDVIANQIFWHSNKVILSILSSPEAVATYSIVFKISYYYMLLSISITAVFLPGITSMVSKGSTKKEISDIFLKIGRIQFILLSCVLTGFVLFGKQFIRLWSLGSLNFEDSYLMTLMIIVPLTLDLVQGLAQTILQAVNKFYFRAVLFLIIDILGIFAAAIIIKLYGGILYALATGLSFLAFVIILNIFYVQSLNLDIMLFWKQILKMSMPVLCCLLMGVPLNYIKASSSIMGLGIKIILYLIIYTVVMWTFVMNSYEKGLLKKPLLRIKNIFTAHKKV